MSEVPLGVVAITMDGDRRILCRGGLSENGGKQEQVPGIQGYMMPVVGKDFPGGATDGQPVRRAMVRETDEEFKVSFTPDRFRRLMSDTVYVEQIRGGEFTRFLVTCFTLRLLGQELDEFVQNGAVFLSGPEELRPRDKAILQLARTYL